MYVDTAVSKGFPGISENHFLNEAVVLGLRHSLPVPDILDRVHIVGQGHLDRGQYRALLNKTGPGSVRAHIRAVGARLLVVDSIAEAVCRETVTGLFDLEDRRACLREVTLSLMQIAQDEDCAVVVADLGLEATTLPFSTPADYTDDPDDWPHRLGVSSGGNYCVAIALGELALGLGDYAAVQKLQATFGFVSAPPRPPDDVLEAVGSPRSPIRPEYAEAALPYCRRVLARPRAALQVLRRLPSRGCARRRRISGQSWEGGIRPTLHPRGALGCVGTLIKSIINHIIPCLSRSSSTDMASCASRWPCRSSASSAAASP